jgi:hypothetical protein
VPGLALDGGLGHALLPYQPLEQAPHHTQKVIIAPGPVSGTRGQERPRPGPRSCLGRLP